MAEQLEQQAALEKPLRLRLIISANLATFSAGEVSWNV